MNNNFINIDGETIKLADTLIYKMINGRNDRLLFTSIVLFLFFILLVYLDIAAGNLFFTYCGIIIAPICFYELYLFKIRNEDIEKHPDFNHILRYKNPEDYMIQFERDMKKGSINFGDCYLLENFIYIPTFYHFKVFAYKEIVWSYIAQTKNYVNFIPAGSDWDVKIFVDTGEELSVRVNWKKNAEEFIETLWDQFLLGHSIHSQTIRNKS